MQTPVLLTTSHAAVVFDRHQFGDAVTEIEAATHYMLSEWSAEPVDRVRIRVTDRGDLDAAPKRPMIVTGSLLARVPVPRSEPTPIDDDSEPYDPDTDQSAEGDDVLEAMLSAAGIRGEVIGEPGSEPTA